MNCQLALGVTAHLASWLLQGWKVANNPSRNYTQRFGARTCFENTIGRNPRPPGVIWIKVDVSGLNTLRGVSLPTLDLPAKKQRAADDAKVLLDVAEESVDWFPPLKSALGGVSALIKSFEVLAERMTVVHD